MLAVMRPIDSARRYLREGLNDEAIGFIVVPRASDDSLFTELWAYQ
jgi:hypothetical protein